MEDNPSSLFELQHIFGGMNEPVNYLTLFSNCFFFYAEDSQVKFLSYGFSRDL